MISHIHSLCKRMMSLLRKVPGWPKRPSRHFVQLQAPAHSSRVIPESGSRYLPSNKHNVLNQMLQGHTFTSACQSYIYCIYPWIPRSMINKYINNDPPPRRTACCTLHVEWSRYVWIQRNHQLQAPASVQTRSQSGYSLEVTTKFRGSFHIIFHVEWAACLHSWSSSIYLC